MDRTTLYVLDWQIRNILRLKRELKNAGQKKAAKLRHNIKSLCDNITHLDPDKTKRLELLSLYFQSHLRTADAQKRLNFLTHSLSNFLFSCGPDTKLDDILFRKLLEHKTIAQVVQNFPMKNHPVRVKSTLAKLSLPQRIHD